MTLKKVVLGILLVLITSLTIVVVGGVFTATESAAIAVIYSLIVSVFIYTIKKCLSGGIFYDNIKCS